ncbi:hypothetical protein G7Y89_g9888 [Cudoniella acicularis]|uniref:alpha-galactosidase n=1 Tax=Cudoniella acicularis TaxID=354080 RepID=A0A8H4RHH7_9HELO|nr:hypothetical protein G7Y89_g9888 [Cudoniella acicularis]
MRSTLSLAFALTFFHSAQAIPRAEVATAATTAPSLTRALRPRPTVGSTWHIQLEKGTAKSPLDLNLPVDVYDVDLFDTDANTQIAKLHENNKYVICYFSAGTYEPDRPDSALLSNIMDYKNSTLNELKDWPGEFWLDVTSDNVMKIMRNRITLAANKSCDGIDPDNLDGYAPDNKNEMGLTPEKLTDYIKKLSTFAQSQGLRMGLKNAGEIVGDVKNVTDWVVQEQCGGWNNVTFEDDDCALWRPFIDDKKPVFRIEYLPLLGFHVNLHFVVHARQVQRTVLSSERIVRLLILVDFVLKKAILANELDPVPRAWFLNTKVHHEFGRGFWVCKTCVQAMAGLRTAIVVPARELLDGNARGSVEVSRPEQMTTESRAKTMPSR